MKSFAISSITSQNHIALKQNKIIVLPIIILIIPYFVQLWIDVGGVTIRIEDVLVLITLFVGLPFVFRLPGELVLRNSRLNFPLLIWIISIIISVMVTLYSSFSSITDKDAVINGARLCMAILLFFFVYNFPASNHSKSVSVFAAILFVSLVTTLVSLLQIVYWNHWLPIALPRALITLKEGANTETGREIFGLFLGDTASHSWAGMLAIQGTAVWFLTRNTKKSIKKYLGYVYFLLLLFILIRISVRTSILGLFFAILSVELIRILHNRSFPYKFFTIFALISISIVCLFILESNSGNSYFLERVRVTLPSIQDGHVVIDRRTNVYGRLEYMRIAWVIFSEHPILGAGFYSYEPLSAQYYPHPIPHAHNIIFQTLAESGFIGLIILGWVILAIARFLYRSRTMVFTELSARVMWEFAMAVFLLILFSSMFGIHFLLPNNVAILMVSLALVAGEMYDRKHAVAK